MVSEINHWFQGIRAGYTVAEQALMRIEAEAEGSFAKSDDVQDRFDELFILQLKSVSEHESQAGSIQGSITAVETVFYSADQWHNGNVMKQIDVAYIQLKTNF